MPFKLTSFLSRDIKSGMSERVIRVIVALAFSILIPVTASAYTVVMRSGRRIEIPSTFVVTSQTLTYEAAPGVNITLMMTGVDIAATERANNESAGSLLSRAQATPRGVVDTSASVTTPARRTLTNKDLEASRRARQQSEVDYERRRIELGLPSLEEVRRRNAAEAERAREQLRQSVQDEAQAENYWRARADELRTEISALDAEINYLRGQLAQEQNYIATPYTSVSTIVPSFPFGRRGGAFSQPVLTGNSGFIHATNAGLQVSGQVGFGGGATRSQLVLNARSNVPLVAPPLIVGQNVYGSPLATYSGVPFQNVYYPTYEHSALVVRLREVEAARAGMQTRWRLLEDEARRAGALPGWLRP